ncbi:hypothetical protein EJ03DRAFT_29236 [Teratosphaeria nubilosa]|uniref:Uncharacterized protein n=1 Tax=Teratosphaeria nubilosa TaxID=161662 RepID=A0A6G1LEW2_9PEZI|nr:hypothetical protein EJ03DRAFT_29236 [Teratosphaeria nubilosa]
MVKGKKKNTSTTRDYVNDINANDLTVLWEPYKTWHRVHGDGKSSTGGKYHMETMKTSNGKYKAKIVEDGAGKVAEVEYDSQPTKEQMKEDLAKKA